MDKIVSYSNDRYILINPIKTKAIIFNPLKTYDVLPLISTQADSELHIEVVEKYKLFGQIVRSDLKTISNT